MLVPYVSIFFLLIAIVLFIVAARQRRHAGIPAGKVIYADTSRWGKVEKPLFEPDIHVSGKPDYLVEEGSQVIPVEVKSGRSPQAPYDSHIYQVAAYCLLVQHVYGARPSHGIIHYPKRTFSVEFTSTLEEAVKSTIREMQERSTRSQVERSHDEPKRCIHCGYRSICDQALRI
jgi:CRISPR-associated exonuclease Cas4